MRIDGAVGIIIRQSVSDLSGPQPTRPRRTDVAVRQPGPRRAYANRTPNRRSPAASRCVAIRPAFSSTADRITLLDSRRYPAGAATSGPTSVATRRPPRGSKGGGERTRPAGGTPSPDRGVGRGPARRARHPRRAQASRSASNREPITAAAFNVRWAGPAEAVDACGDGGLQRGGHTHLSDLLRSGCGAGLPLQHAAFGKLAHHLLNEERVPGGPFGDNGLDRHQ